MRGAGLSFLTPPGFETDTPRQACRGQTSRRCEACCTPSASSTGVRPRSRLATGIVPHARSSIACTGRTSSRWHFARIGPSVTRPGLHSTRRSETIGACHGAQVFRNLRHVPAPGRRDSGGRGAEPNAETRTAPRRAEGPMARRPPAVGRRGVDPAHARSAAPSALPRRQNRPSVSARLGVLCGFALIVRSADVGTLVGGRPLYWANRRAT